MRGASDGAARVAPSSARRAGTVCGAALAPFFCVNLNRTPKLYAHTLKLLP